MQISDSNPSEIKWGVRGRSMLQVVGGFSKEGDSETPET